MLLTVTVSCLLDTPVFALPQTAGVPLVVNDVTFGIPATNKEIVGKVTVDAQPPLAVNPIGAKEILPEPEVVKGLVVNVAFVTGPTPVIVTGPEGVVFAAV
jgi:hypothetical protein